MALPSDFHFSQGSLQDYVDCRRRFQLRYLLKVAWPALEAEPVLENEQAMQQGARFHRLVQQHLLGIPAERLTELAKGDDLNRWWQNYLGYQQDPTSFPKLVGAYWYPEITLSASFSPLPLGEGGDKGGQRPPEHRLGVREGVRAYRLVAKYDLILVLPDGRVTIYDWKTSRKRPKRPWLLDRLQTRVYPYLLSQAGAFLKPPSIPPLPAVENESIPAEMGRQWGDERGADQIEMVYWFAEAPSEPEKIAYSAGQFQKDEQYLKSLVAEIAGLKDGDFYLTPHEERCRFCTYRSLCARGAQAGSLDEAEDEPAVTDIEELDFEHIAEIAF